MQHLITWLGNNKEWVFSGVGIFVLGIVAKLFSQRDTKALNEGPITHNPIASQAPTINASPITTQAPVLNITNNMVPQDVARQPVATLSHSNRAPLFALNPITVTRDATVIAGVADFGNAEICIARFKLVDEPEGSIAARFEASVDYVELISAGGIAYRSRVGHINQAQWLSPNNGVHELVLVIAKDLGLYGAKAIDAIAPMQNRLLELNFSQCKITTTVTLTDLTNGKKMRVEYVVDFDPDTRLLAVRETVGLH